MIPVTKPFLPPLNEYINYLEGIWERAWLTNMGPLSLELEERLKEFLQLNNVLFVTNGTIALQIAIKSLDLKGEIITTPFSFIATTSSIVWEGATPVFVDIDEDSLNIDVKKIELAITSKTSAILATHVYGNPCNVEELNKLAKKYNIKIIYDGAHAFGVKINNRSVFSYGDISTCSLHATKLYHSIEGGIISTNNQDLSDRISQIRNFGFSGPESFGELGVNGKNSELHAAMGLVNLKFIDQIHEKRKIISERYKEKLAGLNIKYQIWHKNAKNNYSYFPIILESEDLVNQVVSILNKNQVSTRRYFYPALSSSLPYLPKIDMEVTDTISKRIICLPIYYDLNIADVDFISDIIHNIIK
jgi:dTDP-4-amino-4,6-dideoxygalactose transaminase